MSIDYSESFESRIDDVRRDGPNIYTSIIEITDNSIGWGKANEITIEYSKKEIINKINSYFGYALISEIKLQTFSSETRRIKNKNIPNKFHKNFENKINEIKNENIKNSLSKLLKAIKE